MIADLIARAYEWYFTRILATAPLKGGLRRKRRR